jgi:hypothetical protein
MLVVPLLETNGLAEPCTTRPATRANQHVAGRYILVSRDHLPALSATDETSALVPVFPRHHHSYRHEISGRLQSCNSLGGRVNPEQLSVDLERTGGYIGQPVRAWLNTKNMSRADAAELRRLVAAVLALPPTPQRAGPPPIPDAMHYRLDIVTGAQRRTVEVTDPDVPAEVRALVSHLLTVGAE